MISRQEFFVATRGRSPGYTTEQLYAAYETYLVCPRTRYSGGQAAVVDCVRCGHCCRRHWRVEAGLQDALRWAGEGRHDILASLERRPRKRARTSPGTSTIIRHLAAQIAGEADDDMIRALTVVDGIERSEGSYVLPNADGCRFLVDGEATTCRIYETRPEVCRRFPEIM